MTKEELERAVNLDKELKSYRKMKDTMSRVAQNWWAFKTPDDEIWLSDNLREKFAKAIAKAVDEAILEVEKEIKKLQ